MWLVQADQDIGPAPCFIRAKAEDPPRITICSCAVTAGHRSRSRGRALLTLTGAERARYQRRPRGTGALQGLPTSMRARLAEGKGKGPGLRLRTENHPAGNEIASVVYWAPRPPPQAQPPSSRFRVAAHLATPGAGAAGCNAPAWRGPDHHGPATSGQPARCWTVCRNLPLIRAMSTREIVTLRIPDGGYAGLIHVSLVTQRSRIRRRVRGRARAPGARRTRGRRPCRWRWPPPAALEAPWRPKAPGPGQPGRPRWPRT
jgi:hypothetical protein